MEGKKKDVTIYDLAHELNVSPSTVSRALNDHYSIGKKTKKAVKKFQLAENLKPDGVVGPKTWDELKLFLSNNKR